MAREHRFEDLADIDIDGAGFTVGIEHFPHPDDFSFWLESPAAKSREYHEGSGKTDALAACAALLRALQSQAQENRKDVS